MIVFIVRKLAKQTIMTTIIVVIIEHDANKSK